MNKKYYSLIKNEANKSADLMIFGDITSWPWLENDVSSYNLSKQLSELHDVDLINVHINSYGGEVAEGLAIYNALRNHPATIKTYADGFACSIASVIFMAGDERIMSKASMLMIHNAWSYGQGNANDLRKQADDLEKINQASINAYIEHINISEEELKDKLDAESWIGYEEALKDGFATSVISEKKSTKASQNAKHKVIDLIMNSVKSSFVPKQEEEDDIMKQFECSECGYIYEGEELPEYFVCPECGADKDLFVEVDEGTNTDDNQTNNDVTKDVDNENDEEKEKQRNQKMVSFFKAMIGGMNND